MRSQRHEETESEQERQRWNTAYGSSGPYVRRRGLGQSRERNAVDTGSGKGDRVHVAGFEQAGGDVIAAA